MTNEFLTDKMGGSRRLRDRSFFFIKYDHAMSCSLGELHGGITGKINPRAESLDCLRP